MAIDGRRRPFNLVGRGGLLSLAGLGTITNKGGDWLRVFAVPVPLLVRVTNGPGRRVGKIRENVEPARDNRRDRPYESVESRSYATCVAAFSCRESGAG
jgi:hypothetical protein